MAELKHQKTRPVWLLISVCERDILTERFATFQDARRQMMDCPRSKEE